MDGVRVLDAGGPNGPVTGQLLALLGAEVVRADASSPLAHVADVVLGRAEAGPHAVTCSITPFGESGPYAEWRASELVAQAMGGMLATSGAPDGPPLRAPGDQAHHQAAVFAAIGIVAALLARERTGRGQHVDVSTQAAVAASLEHVLARYLHDGTVTARTGRLHWTRCFRTGPTRDGWAAYTLLGDWTTLVEWMAADGCAGDLLDPVYAEEAVRRARAEHVFGLIDAWAVRYDGAALEADAQRRRLAFAAVRPPEPARRGPELAGLPFRLGIPPPGPDRAPARRTSEGGPAPLAGVRVADFTWLVAGPTATAILADLGADVVKVEHPRTVDAGDRRGGFTGALNRGKRSVVLDLETGDGRAAALRLALSSDVVIDNFSARVMEQWGLDPASLHAIRPDLICVRMTGFGTAGPDRDRVSFGPTLHARAGYTALMPGPDGNPMGFGFSYGDVASGHLAALAVLAALLRRTRTGAGASVDFSQLDAIAALLTPVPPAPDVAPDGAYPCRGRDRWIAITAATDGEWAHLARAAGRPEWILDSRFASAAARVGHRVELDAAIGAWTRTLDADAAMSALQRAGVSAGRVADARDLCEGDPQLAARGFLTTVPTPEGGRVRLAGLPFRLSESPAGPTRPGPLLGEHTDAVLGELAAREPLSGTRGAR